MALENIVKLTLLSNPTITASTLSLGTYSSKNSCLL